MTSIYVIILLFIGFVCFVGTMCLLVLALQAGKRAAERSEEETNRYQSPQEIRPRRKDQISNYEMEQFADWCDSHRGLSKETKTDSDNDGIAKTVDALAGLDIFERCARRYGRLWADQIELDKQKKEIEENYRALTSLRSSTRSSST